MIHVGLDGGFSSGKAPVVTPQQAGTLEHEIEESGAG
jgi:hypothetical protein